MKKSSLNSSEACKSPAWHGAEASEPPKLFATSTLLSIHYIDIPDQLISKGLVQKSVTIVTDHPWDWRMPTYIGVVSGANEFSQMGRLLFPVL